MKNRLILISFFLLLLMASVTRPFTPVAYAQGAWTWGRANSGSPIDGWPVATDLSGNIYAAGIGSAGSSPFNFGSGVTLPSSYRSVWVKYSPSGTALWAGGTSAGYTWIYNIITDAAGNLIVFGSFSGASMTVGSFTLTNPGLTANRLYLAKVSPTGTVLWAVTDGSGLPNSSNPGVSILGSGGVAVDASGDIYVTSCFRGTSMTLGGGAVTFTNADPAGTTYDVFVAKYTGAGAFVWGKSIGGTKTDNGYGIGVTPGGNVYICGAYQSTSMTVGPSTLTKGSTGAYYDAYIAKFNATTGAPLWGERAGGTYGAFACGLQVDGVGNVYVTGGFADPSVVFGGATINRPYPSGPTRMSLFLVQYSTSDVVTWSKSIGCPTKPIYGFCIALASCGQIWVSGNYKEDANVDGATLAYVIGPDPVFIAGYDLGGTVVGYSGLGSGADDQNGIAADATGHIFICADYYTNSTYPTFTIGPDVFPAVSGEYMYLGKYSPVITPPDTNYTHHDTAVLCGFASATLTAPGGYSAYHWDDGSTLPTRIITSPGDYIVYNTTCGLPVLVDTFHVTLIPTDTTYGRRDTSACIGMSPVTLTAPGGFTTYTWNTGATTSSIAVSAAGNYIVNCVSACAILIDTIHFTFTPNDTTFRRRDTSICAIVAPITLPGPGGYTSYIWSTGSTSSSIPAPASGTYIVYATAGCDTRVDTFGVTYHPMPVISLGNDTGFCVGNTLVLSSAQPAGSDYLWSTGATSSSITVSATGAYWLQVTSSFGCVSADTIHITVTSIPVVDLGPDTTVCTGAPLTLQSSVTYPATNTYLWSSGTSASSYIATATGTYWLEVFDFGCHATDTINVVIMFDTLTVYTHDTAICRGASVYVAATGDPAIHCQWLPTAGIPVSNILNPTITPDTSATYVLTATFPGCKNIVDSFRIDVQPNPNVYMGGNKFVCKDDTLHIHAAVTPTWYTHYGFSWSPGQYFDDSTASTVVYTPGNTMEIYVTVTTPAGCKSEDSAMITVYPDSFALLDTIVHICPHDSAQLLPVSTDPLTTYQWYPSLYIDDVTAERPWVKALTSQTYYAIATSQYGCHDTLHATVVVHPAGIMYLDDSVTIYPGESYNLVPQTNCTSFIWFPPAGLTNPYISNPVATPPVNTKYIVHGTTQWGCPAVDSINIYMSEESILDVPNAFVPGSANSVFRVITRGLVSLHYFRIFNRWGNMIYESNNIAAGWDGTYKGVPQPYGVYVYEVEAETSTGRVVKKHGNVTLIR